MWHVQVCVWHVQVCVCVCGRWKWDTVKLLQQLLRERSVCDLPNEGKRGESREGRGEGGVVRVSGSTTSGLF